MNNNDNPAAVGIKPGWSTYDKVQIVSPFIGLGIGLAIGRFLDVKYGWGLKGYLAFAFIGFTTPVAAFTIIGKVSMKANEVDPKVDTAKAQKLIDQLLNIIGKYPAGTGLTGLNAADQAAAKNISTQLQILGYTIDKTTGKAAVIPGGIADFSMLSAPK